METYETIQLVCKNLTQLYKKEVDYKAKSWHAENYDTFFRFILEKDEMPGIIYFEMDNDKKKYIGNNLTIYEFHLFIEKYLKELECGLEFNFNYTTDNNIICLYKQIKQKI